MLTVADTGVGMTPEVQDRIFEPFFTTKDSDKGTGLGLSTVVGIINDHKGDIRVYSFVGRGSAFNVYLPVQNLPEPAVTNGHAHDNLDGQQRLVLLVDDEANIRTVCGAALRKHNFRVVEANNGTEALLKITELKSEIGCVVTDIHMPNLDGVGFIRIVKRMLPGLPIIAMSGRLEGAELEQLRAQKITAIIEKPFPVKTLLAAMAAMK
jgi:CheY-like chemotaxis protein